MILTEKRKTALAGFFFISPWLIGLIVMQLGPMFYSMYLSLNNFDLFRPPTWVGLGNYQKLLTNDKLFWTALGNTAYYVVGRVPFALMLSLFVAVLLNQKIPLRSFLRTAYYLPSVTPQIAMIMLWIWLFDPQWGLINWFLGLFGIPGLPWLASVEWAKPSLILMSGWSIGATMIIFLAGLQGVPEHLYEAAELDGATTLRKIWHVTLPMISPVIFFNVVMGVISSFQMFEKAFVMTGGGPGYATFVYALYIYNQAFMWFRMGYGAALAWVLFAILFVFTYIMFRRQAWVYYEAGGR